MKQIPERNLRVKHVIVDPALQVHDVIPAGRQNLRLTDIVLETVEGNHTLTHYYVVI